jgi:hypothetical protein
MGERDDRIFLQSRISPECSRSRRKKYPHFKKTPKPGVDEGCAESGAKFKSIRLENVLLVQRWISLPGI